LATAEASVARVQDQRHAGAGVPRLNGKGIALLLTGGGEEAGNADLVVAGFRQLIDYLKGRMAGHLFVGGCTVPTDMSGDVKNRAAAFARTVAKDR
jgi:hypothetical protein